MNPQLYLTIFLLTGVLVVFGAVFSSRKYYKKLCKEALEVDLDVGDMIKIEQTIQQNTNIPKRKNGENTQEYIWAVANNLKIQNGGTAPIVDQAELNEKKDGTYQVVFQRGLSKEKCVFALAHECGHILNEDPSPSTRPDSINKPKMEQLADYAGAAILLPKKDMESFLMRNNYQSSTARQKEELIKLLSKTYGVSIPVVLRRIEEVLLINSSELV